MVKFGERLKAARTAKHMSQQALADVSADCVSRAWRRSAFWLTRWRFPATICWRARILNAR